MGEYSNKGFSKNSKTSSQIKKLEWFELQFGKRQWQGELLMHWQGT
jgi:hypothetical protein